MSSRNTFFLLLTTLLFVLVGTILDRLTGRANDQFALSFLAAALAMNGFFYLFSDKIILAQAAARPLPLERAPRLHAMAERLAKRARIPKPALYWTASPLPNAFATGRDPSHAAVAVTLGLIRALDERQAEAVLAHEIAHIKNRDTLAASILAAIAGSFAYLGRGLMPFSARGALLGGLARGVRFSLFAVLLGLAAPFAALLLKLAASRSREFAADEEAAALIGAPGPLASALRRMDSAQESDSTPMSPGLLVLMTISPKTGGRLARLLRTHPPLRVRLRRLEALRRP